MPVQDHIHLETIDNQPWTTDNAPDNTYKVSFGDYNQKPTAWTEIDIALNATVHVHQLKDDSGDVVQRDYFSPTLILTDTEYDTLKGEVGKKVDFVPIVSPDAGSDHSAYVTEMLLTKMRVRELDPMLNYYKVTVDLEPTE